MHDLPANPDLGVWLQILVIAASFLGSAITATFSIGGGLLLIAVMGTILPATALIPVHGTIMLGSNAGRAVVYRHGLDWAILPAFLAGSLIGAAIGGQVVVTLPSAILRIVIGSFIIFSQWGPGLRLPFGRKSLAVAGAFSTFLTLFVGASGPFMTSILAQKPGYDRINLLSTAAAVMVVQHGLKVLVFALAGFAFASWLPLILASIAAGFMGTLLGSRLLSRLDETQFRKALKWILTALAIYMIFMALLKIF